MLNLTTATPAEIDTELAPIVGRASRAATAIRAAQADARRYRARGRERFALDAEARIPAAEAELTKALADRKPFDAEWSRRGGWTRAFIVPGGHVHRTDRCSTCYIDTDVRWLPEWSGQDETEIVEAAGERACTVCYPSAPVDVRNRPSRIHTPEERAAAAEREQRNADKARRSADKAAKAITNPDGSTLYGEFSSIATLRSAEIEYVGMLADTDPQGWRHDSADRLAPVIARIETAIAAKRAMTTDEVRTEYAPKVAAKIKRDQKEAAKFAAQYNR